LNSVYFSWIKRGTKGPWDQEKSLKMTAELCILKDRFTARGGGMMGTKKRGKTEKRKTARSIPPPELEKAKGGTPKAEEERFDVAIYRAWCKGCGICVAFCPKEVLSMNERGEPHVTSPERCTGCTWCELRCPDFAISVKRREKKGSEARLSAEKSRGGRMEA
jgi:2-oxoglutarate ferredoxin oxidoreductase subunit delta